MSTIDEQFAINNVGVDHLTLSDGLDGAPQFMHPVFFFFEREIRSYGRTGYMKGKAFDGHFVQL